MSSERLLLTIGLFFGLLVVALMLIEFVSEADQCDRHHGVFVKSVFWYECVEKRR